MCILDEIRFSDILFSIIYQCICIVIVNNETIKTDNPQ